MNNNLSDKTSNDCWSVPACTLIANEFEEYRWDEWVYEKHIDDDLNRLISWGWEDNTPAQCDPIEACSHEFRCDTPWLLLTYWIPRKNRTFWIAVSIPDPPPVGEIKQFLRDQFIENVLRWRCDLIQDSKQWE